MIRPVRTGLDRLAHRRTDAQWLAQAWERALVLVVSGDRVLVGPGDALALVPSGQAPAGDRFFLGGDGAGTVYFVVVADLPALPATRPATLREVAHRLPELDATLMTTALALVNWHRRHAYSPADGSPTTVGDGGWIRVTRDGRSEFPRTDPAVIVLVHDGVAGEAGRCLLGHNATWTRPGWERRFSCLAGFVEPGESAEGAVEREVFEEVGVRLTGISYAGSQAWPFPGSLMLGFTAVADPAEPLVLDRTEIDEARWVTRSGVRAAIEGGGDGVRLPPPASIAFLLISGWLGSGKDDRPARSPRSVVTGRAGGP